MSPVATGKFKNWSNSRYIAGDGLPTISWSEFKSRLSIRQAMRSRIKAIIVLRTTNTSVCGRQ